MWSFRNNRLFEAVDVSVANLMAALGRYQGRQELYTHQAPRTLETLQRIAIIESAESSNRIEGIVIPTSRLQALMSETAPQTRSESEIAGYRDLLARIHTGQLRPPLTPRLVLDMHAALYAYLPGEGGAWKQRDNVIRQRLPDGSERVRFVPLPASETPAAMEELCLVLSHAWSAEHADHLLSITAFILDFLCIHPFSDGNGRLARLLNLMLLNAAGYQVGRYISLERVIEQTKETYYEALFLSSQRWDSGQHDLTPWRQYSLGTLVYAYREFEQNVLAVTDAPGGKSQAVRAVIQAFHPDQEFSISDLERACPAASRPTIRRVLEDLQRQELIERLGAGRAARWRKKETRS